MASCLSNDIGARMTNGCDKKESANTATPRMPSTDTGIGIAEHIGESMRRTYIGYTAQSGLGTHLNRPEGYCNVRHILCDTVTVKRFY